MDSHYRETKPKKLIWRRKEELTLYGEGSKKRFYNDHPLEKPGVYILYDYLGPLRIGESTGIRTRIFQHRRQFKEFEHRFAEPFLEIIAYMHEYIKVTWAYVDCSEHSALKKIESYLVRHYRYHDALAVPWNTGTLHEEQIPVTPPPFLKRGKIEKEGIE